MLSLGIFGVAIVGLLAGWIAKRVLNRGQSLFANLLVGLVGAMLGAWVAEALDLRFVGLLGGLLVATLGALFLLASLAIVRR